MELISKCMEIIGTMRELSSTVKKAMFTIRNHVQKHVIGAFFYLFFF